MELTLFLRTCFVLLCKLLLVDVVCAYVADRLLFTTTGAKNILGRPTTSSNVDLGLQVIICGFPRCGSASLWQAMNILGFPCFHGAHLFNPSFAKLFLKAEASGSHQDWKKLLQGFRSIADYPATSYYKKLMEIYPNAKIVLNIRDPEGWYNSFSQTLLKARAILVRQVIQPCGKRCNEKALYQRLLQGKQENKEISITNYKLHIEEVKRHVPSHKLYILEIEKNEGWAPLCKFLEVPVPDVPFPFTNRREDFNQRMKQRSTRIYTTVLISYLALVFSIIFQILKCIFSK